MAEVKWTARRVSDGVLVDVTGDTTGTPVSAPTANELETGAASGSGLSLLGPFTINYNTSNIETAGGVQLAALAANVVVLDVGVFLVTVWNNASAANLYVADSTFTGSIAWQLVDLLTPPAQYQSTKVRYGLSAVPLSYFIAADGIWAKIARTGSAPTAGQAEVRALVYTP